MAGYYCNPLRPGTGFDQAVNDYLKRLEKDAANCKANAAISSDSTVVRKSKQQAEVIEFVIRAARKAL
jgi:RNase adaptor protein for sRNA GlmZ degradation